MQTESQEEISRLFIGLLRDCFGDIYGDRLPSNVADELGPAYSDLHVWMHGMPPVTGQDEPVADVPVDDFGDLLAELQKLSLGEAGPADV